MAKPTYLEEFIPFMVKSTVIVTLLGAIIVGVISSFLSIDIPDNSTFFTFSLGLSFILFHLLYFKGKYLLLEDKIEDLENKLKSKETLLTLLKDENKKLKNKITTKLTK